MEHSRQDMVLFQRNGMLAIASPFAFGLIESYVKI